MIFDRFPGHIALGIDELVELFLFQQTPIDDAHGADGDDFIAALGIEPGGFGIEHRVGQCRQWPIVQLARLPGLLKQIEVIVFGPGFR